MTGQSPGQIGRRSIRLKGYDYSRAGGYFITIVAFRQECLFGEVVGGEMRVNPLGRIAQEEWFRSARIRKEIRLFEDEFVVMPYHIHGIVWIDTNMVGADGVRPIKYRGASLAPLHRKSRSLGSFIAGFKSSVTRRLGKELNSGNIWQRNFFEHIIRDQDDYIRIAGYIFANPANWDRDEENPTTLS